jgi:hypothetical protein
MPTGCSLFVGQRGPPGWTAHVLKIARSNDQAAQIEALALAEMPVGSLNSLYPSSLKIPYSHYYNREDIK